MDFLPPSTNFLLLRLYMVSSDLFHAAATAAVKLVRGIQAAFSERTYLFLEGYSTPFPEQAVNAYASSSAAVEFFYNADKHEFSTGAGTKKSLPILSLEIARDGVVLFDLTDFIEKVTVVSAESFPSVSHLTQAWMIDSHVILDRACDFVARIISNSGTSYEFDVRDDLDLAGAMMEADELDAAKEEKPLVEEEKLEPLVEKKPELEQEPAAAVEPLKIE